MFRSQVLFAGALLVSTWSSAAQVAIDLTTWQQRGPTSNGNWVVAPGGTSVVQTINGDPTFFVSPNNQINTTLRGKIRVESTSDDDMIGFVFGFQGPVSTGVDMNFLIFDWKQSDQGSAREGFALSRVNGTVPAAQFDPVFWDRVDNAAFGYDSLATRFGANEGWQDNVEYDFTMLYQTDRIKIDIAGGAFGTGQTIFDVAGTFIDGRFGFYNYSQSNVRYSGLTEEATPPGPVPVPLPGSVTLVGLGLALLSLQRRRS